MDRGNGLTRKAISTRNANFNSVRRHGPAFRWYEQDESKLFSLPPFNQFTGPYKSSANFESGSLDGVWTITDAKGREICRWSFRAGRRHGQSIWKYNTGDVFRELNYLNGELHGPFLEYLPDQQIATDVEFINGRRLEKHTETNDNDEKIVEGMMLRARLSLKTPEDWWKAKLAKYTKEGKDEKHGRWTAWYPSGQKKLEGEYQYNLPSGEYTWWHENGQKSIQGFLFGW